MGEYLSILSLDKFNEQEIILLIYLALISIIAFLAMGIDKSKAKKKKHRISESTLMILSLIGGSIGILLGMTMFRHKTSKNKFYIGVPIIYIITQIIVLLVFNYIK